MSTATFSARFPRAAEAWIPAPPQASRIARRPAESWWREAMRWSLIGLTASLAAGEVALWMLVP